MIWLKGPNVDDPSTISLLSHNKLGPDYTLSDRYALGPDVSLLLKGVESGDDGRYICQVIPRNTIHRDEAIDVRVIGETLGLFETSGLGFVFGFTGPRHSEAAFQTACWGSDWNQRSQRRSLFHSFRQAHGLIESSSDPEFDPTR